MCNASQEQFEYKYTVENLGLGASMKHDGFAFLKPSNKEFVMFGKLKRGAHVLGHPQITSPRSSKDNWAHLFAPCLSSFCVTCSQKSFCIKAGGHQFSRSMGFQKLPPPTAPSSPDDTNTDAPRTAIFKKFVLVRSMYCRGVYPNFLHKALAITLGQLGHSITDREHFWGW